MKLLGKLEDLFERLGLEPLVPELYQQALTHPSLANESGVGDLGSNQRLEFLGDAVLQLAISDELFRRFPSKPEGELTKMRAAVVCEPTLAKLARSLDLGQSLLLGRGEEATGGRARESILADALEAVIGAVYLDLGLDRAREVVARFFRPEVDLVERGEHRQDYKTLLQELAQRTSDERLRYQVVSDEGPDHQKTFLVAVSLGKRPLGRGTGRSKKEAEQNAARDGLQEFGASDRTK